MKSQQAVVYDCDGERARTSISVIAALGLSSHGGRSRSVGRTVLQVAGGEQVLLIGDVADAPIGTN